MRSRFRRPILCSLAVLCLTAGGIIAPAFGSAYNGHPKLVVIVVIDQFRADYLDRYRADFGSGGFNLFLEHGAVFTDCQYGYASTRTAPGHATLLTGAYSDQHGIFANDYWDPDQAAIKDSKGDSCGKVPYVWDKNAQVVWLSDTAKQPSPSICTPGSVSPHNLKAATLGDELKQATQGRSRVYAVSLKERAAVFPGGFSANAAFWPDEATELVDLHDVFEFEAVAESAAGGDERVLEFNATKANGQVGAAFHGGRGGGRCGRVSGEAYSFAHGWSPVGWSASVSTRPIELDGGSIPRMEESVGARSTGSAWLR